MNQLLLVILGGGLGSGARYLVSAWLLARLGLAFPWGTLTVDVVGSFLLGVIMQICLTSEVVGADTRLLLTTGSLGGFTTYSAFNYETLRYCQEGNGDLAVANTGATFTACLFAGYLGDQNERALGGHERGGPGETGEPGALHHVEEDQCAKGELAGV